MFDKRKQTITALIREPMGVDAFNHPQYQWTEHAVDGVLAIYSTSDTDTAVTEDRRDKITQHVTLYIPKTCTLDFTNAKVIIDGVEYEVQGAPKAEYSTPTDYNQVVKAQRITG